MIKSDKGGKGGKRRERTSLAKSQEILFSLRKQNNASAAGGLSRRHGQKVEKRGEKVEEFHLAEVFTPFAVSINRRSMKRKFFGVLFDCSPEEVESELNGNPSIEKWAYVFHKDRIGVHFHVYIEVSRDSSRPYVLNPYVLDHGLSVLRGDELRYFEYLEYHTGSNKIISNFEIPTA